MIDYSEILISDLDEIEELYRKHLDNGSLLRERIEEVLCSEKTLSCKATDKETGKIAGIIIYTYGISFSCGHPELCKKVEDIIGDSYIYTGESFLVDNSYRGQHISSNMMNCINCKLKEIRRDLNKDIYVLHEMWVYPDGKIPAYNFVNKIYGVSNDLGIIKGFYKEYYLKGHLCPVCGEKCVCAAKITLSKI